MRNWWPTPSHGQGLHCKAVVHGLTYMCEQVAVCAQVMSSNRLCKGWKYIKQKCKRSGCTHQHHGGPRDHGFCCNACRRNEGRHTINCFGWDDVVKWLLLWEQTEQIEPLWRENIKEPDQEPMPMEECSKTEALPVQHATSVTLTISNPDTLVQLANLLKQQCPSPAQSVPKPLASFQSPTLIEESCARGYCIPYKWACKGDILGFVQWFNKTFNMQYSNDLLNNWKSLDRVLPFIQDKWQRPLVIEVCTENDPQFKFMMRGCSNVAHRGLTWTIEEMPCEITGCNPKVHAMYIGQAATIDIMAEAIQQIQIDQLATYTFACRHATHRSVACAILLAMIGYPKAEIHLKTPRTKKEALKCGLLRAE